MNNESYDPELKNLLTQALAIHFASNKQPHMSGDPLNRLNSMEKRKLDDAVIDVLDALILAGKI